MNEILYLAKIGEINLKKGNLRDFELRLVQNMRFYLADTKPEIRVRAGRMYIRVKEEFRTLTEHALDTLLGITGWAEAVPAEKNMEAVIETVRSQALKARENAVKRLKSNRAVQIKIFL